VLDNFEHLLDARDLLTQVIEEAAAGGAVDDLPGTPAGAE
jgi:hypothetical protein